MTIVEFQKTKGQRPLSLLTCYDFWSAQILDKTNIDALLVGDSLAMVMHGASSTLPATPELIALHTKAVVAGAPSKHVIADLPFLAGRISIADGMRAIQLLMQAGAHSIKIEGAGLQTPLIAASVDAGVPIMGHLGLTPQSVHGLSGYKVQGKQQEQADRILQDARELEKAGVYALVLECVPLQLGKLISEELKIPIIGIGAGPHTDGQILVLQDLLGLQQGRKPQFVRSYLNGFNQIQEAVQTYCNDVQDRKFPSKSESYDL